VESVPSKINPWRYLSKCKDPETGFIFFGRRYYDPAVGRWMTADPKGYMDSMNLYAFALNDPFMLIDPYGLENEALQKISSAGAFTLNNAGQGFCHPIDTLRSFSGDIQGLGQAALAWNFSSYSAAWQSMTWEERFQLFTSKGLQAGGLALAVASIPRTAVCHGAGLLAAETRAGFSYIASRFFTRQTLPTEFSLSMPASRYAANTSSQSTRFLKFTKDTYRENLIRLTGINPGKACDAHHIFPQEFRKDFARRGINIDDPKYLTWFEKSIHRPTAKAYNDEWREFIFKPGRTNDEIFQFGRKVMTRYGITDLNY